MARKIKVAEKLNTKKLTKSEHNLLAEEIAITRANLLNHYNSIGRGGEQGLTEFMHWHGRYIALDRLGLVPGEQKIDSHILDACQTIMTRYYNILQKADY
jgi:hypothetical protein